MPRYIRSYPLQHHCNAGKVAVIKKTLADYRCACQSLALVMWRTFFQETGAFANRLDCKAVTTCLSSRYTQTACVQVAGVLNSFLSNRKNDFTLVVARSNLSEVDKHILYTINRELRLVQERGHLQEGGGQCGLFLVGAKDHETYPFAA